MFGRVEGRSVVAEFDGGALTSDAGGLLLGAVNGAAIFLKSGAAKFPSLAGLGDQPCG
jgi:hypothetical protein